MFVMSETNGKSIFWVKINFSYSNFYFPFSNSTVDKNKCDLKYIFSNIS